LTDERYDRGMKTRRSVLGDAYVDRAEAKTTAFDADFQRYLTESVWGSIWNRPDLGRRERSLVTVALLAALGFEQELAIHVRATRNTGASMAEVREVLLHVAAYAGVPAAHRAFAIVKAVYEEPEARAERKTDGG
jgi:4-carboxymuconolactone decarboxylase